jgi:protein phosphatase
VPSVGCHHRVVPVVVIRDPSLVVLVGAAGSGKSTLAGRHFAEGEVLSSDAYRERISGDAGDQSATRPAFAALQRDARRRLRAGLLTVVDATSVEAHARKALLRIAREAGVPATAIVLDLPARVVLARNAGRAGRRVETAVVRHHLGVLRRALDSGRIRDEPWARLVVLRHPGELDQLKMSVIATKASAIPTAWLRVTRSRSTVIARRTVVTG